VALGPRHGGLSFAGLGDLVGRGAAVLDRAGGHHIAYLGTIGPAFSTAVLAAAHLGRPVVPLNYRLPAADLRTLLGRLDDPVLLVDDVPLAPTGGRVLGVADWLAAASGAEPVPSRPEGDPIAVVLFTSGTTAAPKGVLLAHDQLLAYVLQTVEFAAGDPDEAALVTVPPYHVAGLASVLTNLYAGRRVLHLAAFEPGEWLRLVREERITGATVVPTMLARLVEHLEATGATVADVPSLRSLAYGGAPLAPRVLRRALELFPDVGFANAYGLTETSSTIAVLDADDHRAAIGSDDPDVRARLGSAGRPVPGIEVAIRDADGGPVGPGLIGDLFVRGPQVSGAYMGSGTALDGDGWFPTRDRARRDGDGYLYIEGRSDDTIIRGGENVAPAEIEAVLREHADVTDIAVVGLPDEQWGQRIAAAVVLTIGADATPAQLRAWAAERLRSSRTPDLVVIVDALPYSPTGKLLRRNVADDLTAHPRRTA
jgi:acyl-CoA synthetase (AMP-forming)/AMP-acid ligase II